LPSAGIAVIAGIIRLRVFARAAARCGSTKPLVAMNLVQRSFRALVRSHSITSRRPHRCFSGPSAWPVLVGGNTEWALRALPLVAGLLLPFAMLVGSRDGCSPPIEALVPSRSLALSPFLIYYANEVKPYGIDALVTALLFARGASRRGTAGVARALDRASR
jgi:hypothetical protein